MSSLINLAFEHPPLLFWYTKLIIYMNITYAFQLLNLLL